MSPFNFEANWPILHEILYACSTLAAILTVYILIPYNLFLVCASARLVFLNEFLDNVKEPR